MNKTKMILAITGGAIGLVVLVLAFLVWQAFSEKTAAIEGDFEAGTDGLEAVESRAMTLSRKAVYPSAEGLAAVEANQTLVDEWRKESLALAARGDKVFEATTPAAFKTFLVSDAKRIAELPGAVSGRFVQPDFAFGPFKDYIAEGKMPAEAELKELQRKWDDVAAIATTLSKCGVSELVDVQFAVVNREEGKGKREEDKRDARGKGDKRKGKSNNQTIKQSINSFSYVFTFLARPSAFVRALNELTACARFTAVDDFSFARSEDAIAQALGGDEKKDDQSAASGRRGRRGRRGSGEAASRPLEEDEKSEQKNGVITDPFSDAPLKVSLTVSVHDFRSLEESGEADSSPLKKSGQETASPLEKGATK